jgi:hypothetical protein
MPERETRTEEQKTAQQISAMNDSVYIIDKLIVEGNHTKRAHDNIDRNIRHLELMINQNNIKNSGNDLTVFENTIEEGKVFIDNPVVE